MNFSSLRQIFLAIVLMSVSFGVYAQCVSVGSDGTASSTVNCTGSFSGRIGASGVPPAGFNSGAPTQNNITVNTGSGAITLDSATFGTNTATILLGNSANISVGNGGTVSAPSSGAGVNNEAIFIGNSGTINIGAGATVINYATGGSGPPTVNAGNNTIEIGSNNNLTIQAGATVYAAGTSGSSEAINPLGSGNTITNYGTIQSKTGSAIWFQSATPTLSPNIVNNYGSIISEQANQTVFGGNGSVNFTNQTGGYVQGNVAFANGVNTVTLYTGSTITGFINGGPSGQNTFNLEGNGGSTLVKQIINFSTLNKNGTGFWTIDNPLPTAIRMNVNQGTLQLNGDNTAFTGIATINPDATLQGTAAAVVGSTGNGRLTNNGTISFIDSGAGTYSAPIIGLGAVAMNGSGSVTLSGVNTYSGGTTVNSGTVVATNNNSIGTGALVLNNGATFQAGAPVSFGNSVVLTGQSNIDTNGNALGLSGVISGLGPLNKIGAGTLTLSGANTYTGNTNLTAGTLAVASNTALGTGSLAMTSGTTLQAASTASLANAVNMAGIANIDTNGNALGLSGVISGLGPLNKIGAGTLTLSGANTYTGNTNLTAGTLAVASNTALGTGSLAMTSGTTLQAASTASLANAVNMAGIANIDTNGNALGLSGVISGLGPLNKIGAGTLTLSGANTYTGNTNLTAGTTILTGSIGIGGGTSLVTVSQGAALQGNGVINGNLTNAGLVAPSFNGVQTNLTVNGNYIGAGGIFAPNIYGPVSNPVSDTLTVNGNTSGSTSISVTDKGGLGFKTTGNGIPLVLVSGTSAINAFYLSRRVEAGAYEYHLYKGGPAGVNNSWYLSTVPVDDGGAIVEPDRSERIEVAVYPALPTIVQLYSQTIVDTLDQRRGDLNLISPQTSGTKNTNDWARIIGKTGSSTPTNVNNGPKLNFNNYALQFGVDLFKHEEDGARTYAGPYVTIGGSNGNTSNQAGTVSTGNINGLQGYSIGLYATHFAENGLYADALVQGTKYLNANVSSVQGNQLKTQGSGFTGSLEAGGRWYAADRFLISPQAQILYDSIGLNNATDAGGQINFNKSEGSRGRLGVLVGHKDVIGTTPIFAYLRASYWKSFSPATTTTFASLYGVDPIGFQSQIASNWMTIDAELNARITKDTNLFLNVAMDNSFVGTYQAYSGRIGLQTRF